MTKRYHLYALGNALVDTEVEISDEFLQRMEIGKGMMTLVDEPRQQALLNEINGTGVRHKRASGGSACNTIVAARYFGANTYYACKVADDDDGRFFVHDLTAAGVETNMHGARADGITGKCLVMVTPDAERTMNTFLGVSETVSETELDEAAIRAAEYVYIEGYLVTSDNARSAAVRLREIAEQHDVKTAMTFSDPAMARFFRDGLEEMLGNGVDLLFCNEEEAMLFTGKDTLEGAMDSLMQVSRSLVVTCGARGAIAWDGDEVHRIDAEPVRAVDTNGAGDMFAGAFLYGVTHGHGFAAAGRLASAASAKVVSDFGPRLEPALHQTLRDQVLGK